MNTTPSVIAVVGPTAVGKTKLADILALKLDSCVVSADSMQIYKGMNIGTSKLDESQRSVPYYCIDILEPGESYSAALFQYDAREIIQKTIDENKIPVLCGGTGLYVRAAMDDFQFPSGEQEDNPIRSKYALMLNNIGPQSLHDFLKKQDPASAELIHPNNSRRVVRALEMLDQGQSYAEQNKGFSQFVSYFDCCYLGLRCSRELLYQIIEERVDTMFAQGLVEEVTALRNQGYEEGLTAPQAIGYKEVILALDGELTMEEASDLIKQSTRRYAKRQMTWFNKDERIAWLDVDAEGQLKPFEQLFAEAQAVLSEQGISL